MIKTLPTRYPEIGRLRAGDKELVEGRGGKQVERPRKAENWIFACDDEETLQVGAGIYGGRVEQWEGGEQKFRLYSDSDTIDALLPPDALFSAYERWGSGGCTARCDGVTAMVAERNAEGDELVEKPCVCLARNWTPGDPESIKKGACDLVVRVKLVIQDLPGLGVWLFSTGSIYAAMELPGQVALIDRLREHGALVPVQFVLQARTEKKAWEKYERRYRVPTLRIRQTMQELAERAGVAGELGGPARAALGPGEHRESSRPSTIGHFAPHVRSVIITASELGLTDEERHALVFAVTKGRVSSAKDVTAPEAGQVLAALADGSWEQLVVAGNQPTTVVAAGPVAAEGTAGETAHAAATADAWAREIAAQDAIPDPAAPAELLEAWRNFVNLPADLKAEGFDYLERHAVPKDWHELTPAQITEITELVESLRMERDARDRDAAAAKPGDTTGQQTLDGGEAVWGAKQWTAAAKAAGTTGPSALKQARSLAADLGVDPPSSLDDITDDSLASRLRGWLAERRAS